MTILGSLVRRFANDFHSWLRHSWLRHSWKSLANRVTRDPKIVIHGNSCIILYILFIITYDVGYEWSGCSHLSKWRISTISIAPMLKNKARLNHKFDFTLSNLSQKQLYCCNIAGTCLKVVLTLDFGMVSTICSIFLPVAMNSFSWSQIKYIHVYIVRQQPLFMDCIG